MAVFELEQRYVPLIECQHVWQPWGVAGRYCLDEEGNVSEAPVCSRSMRRARSWGGYASCAMRRRFSNPEDMADSLNQFKEAADREKEVQGASRQRISPNGFQDMLLAEDEEICQSWSQPAVEAKRAHFPACLSECCDKGDGELGYPSESTGFSSEVTSPCFSSEADSSPIFSSESSSAVFSSEASQGSACSSPQRQRRRRRAPAIRQAGATTGSFASVMLAKEEAGCVGGPEITTLMVQNVPYNLTREEFLAEVEVTGFPAGEVGYNFCHLPRIFKTGKNQGFAFLNFESQAVAERFAKVWHNNRSFLQGNLQKPLRVKVAAMQGIEACEKFARSKKMQRVKTGTFKPLVVAAAQPVMDIDAMATALC